jgi:preprotein translocase subunit SecE
MPPAKTPTRLANKRGAAKAPPPSRGRLGGLMSRMSANRQPSGPRKGGSVGELLRDVRQELRKVEWPHREQAVKLTGAVVGLSAAVGLFLGGVDYVFQELFKFIINLGNPGAI